MKKVVMQHVIRVSDVGGPLTGYKILVDSDLSAKYNFVPLNQSFAPNGINFALFFYLYKQIKLVKPDILHIRGLQSEGFYGVLAGRLAGCKRIVLSVHGFYSDALGVSKIKRFFFRFIVEPITLRLADSVYCVCEYATRRLIIRRHAKNLWGFIHNIAPDYSVVGEDRKSEFRREFGINSGDIVITTVSRITIDKGYGDLVLAIKVLKKRKNIKFILVGDGPYFGDLKSSLLDEIKMGLVVLTGKRADISTILQCSDIFVFPTLHENLSNALLEACAASLPCVATRVGGNTEVVLDQFNGFLVPPHNPVELANKIDLLISSDVLRSKFGINSKHRIESHFSKRIILPKIDSIYNSLLIDV